MAVTIKLYGPAVQAICNGGIKLWDDDIKLLLATAVTFDQNDVDFDDLTFTEVSGESQGYDTGGKDVTPDISYSTRVTTVDDTADEVKWENSTITASHAILYKDGVGNANKRPIAHIAFGESIESVNGDFEVEWHNNGIFTLTVPA